MRSELHLLCCDMTFCIPMDGHEGFFTYFESAAVSKQAHVRHHVWHALDDAAAMRMSEVGTSAYVSVSVSGVCVFAMGRGACVLVRVCLGKDDDDSAAALGHSRLCWSVS